MDIVINPKRRRTEKAPVNEETIDGDGADNNGIDRISDLPNEILCRILLFLPTKYAVGTSILSTKWKNLLALTPNLRLRIDDTLLLHPESASNTDLTSFVRFANNLLHLTLRGAPPIYSFTLICKRFNDGHFIANWITAALRLNIKRMEIRVRRPQNYRFLLDSLYGCNIVFLHLFLDVTNDATEFRFSLPNLKILYIQCMRFRPVNVLLASCPSLKYLMLQDCYCIRGERLRICIPSLRALVLYNFINMLDCLIELDTPQLLYLNHSGYFSVRYVGAKRKSPWLARLGLEEEIGQLYPLDSDERITELVKLCSGVEKLWLSERIISVLYHHPHRLPRFQKLVDLAIRQINSHGWELLPSLLACAPKLKNLYLKAGFDMDRYESLKATVKDSMSISLVRSENFVLLAIERKVKN